MSEQIMVVTNFLLNYCIRKGNEVKKKVLKGRAGWKENCGNILISPKPNLDDNDELGASNCRRG
jgi:hypothetical protein